MTLCELDDAVSDSEPFPVNQLRAAVLASDDLRRLLDLWLAVDLRDTWDEIGRRAQERGDQYLAAQAVRALMHVPEVSGLDGLRVNTRIVEVLTSWRWLAIRQALETGHSWAEIGETLQCSADEARMSYEARIAELEQDPDWLYDGERTRVSLQQPSV